MRACLRCDQPITGHFNRKRCEPCAALLRKRPASHLTERQVKVVLKYAGRIPQKELAIKIKSSRSNLIRWASRHAISLDSLSYKPEVVRAVCGFYEMHGRRATERAFPKVSVRSIIEHKGLGMFKPRQTRWDDKSLLEAARMAGLVSPEAQAKYFNRPGAHRGSIKSLWTKRFGFGACKINGMAHWHAKHLVTVKARYLRPYGEGRDGKPVQFRRLILWVNMEKCLKPDVPEFIRDAVKTMAQFQRWLHATPDPATKIKRMIREREAACAT